MRFIHLAIPLLISISSFTVAQDYPKAEVYGGYSYVNIDTNVSSRQSANGWEASISGNFTRMLGVEAAVSGYYKTYSINLDALNLGVLNVKVTDYSYGAGPRINIRPLFIHALLGGDHLTGSAMGFSESQDSLAGAFGGGVEWPVSKQLGVRASVDYVFTRHNIFGGPSYTQNNVRAGVGVVYRFGRHSVTTENHATRTPPHSGTPITALGLVATTRDIGGAAVAEVDPGGVAERSGLKAGDVITAINGKPINTSMELAVALSDRQPGAKVTLGVLVRGQWQSEMVIILPGQR